MIGARQSLGAERRRQVPGTIVETLGEGDIRVLRCKAAVDAVKPAVVTRGRRKER
jgi:hypothetical protein